MKNFLSIKLQSFLIITSSLIVIYLLGFDFIKLNNQDWFNSGDLSTYQLGWKYFKEDSWRFPIGLNPNYGIYLNGSIIFSDSVPFFAIFFKIFKSILPMNFQYFSIWIFVCLYLQLFFSFKIIYNLTGNFLYSLIGSLFFIFAAAFIHRGAIHLSLFAHWIILSGFYIEIIESKCVLNAGSLANLEDIDSISPKKYLSLTSSAISHPSVPLQSIHASP